MQHSRGKGALALIVGLLFVASGSAYAQDTTETGRAPIDTMAPEAEAIDTAAIDTAAIDSAAVDTAARDTTDTSDTSGVQNPPGYRGMERDTSVFPDTGAADQGAQAVEDQTTGTYEDTAAAGSDTTRVGETQPREEDEPTPRMDTTESSWGGDTTGQAPDSAQ